MSPPVKGIPKILKLKIPETECFKSSNELRLPLSQWKAYLPDPSVVLLDKMNGRRFNSAFKNELAYTDSFEAVKA